MDTRKLNVVDEEGKVIGEETRENIHRQGLLHREIHVWFYTPTGEIIFQHRAKDKETYPDLLDATVGGHVEIGQDYLDAALAEMREETGIAASADDLRLVQMTRGKTYDQVTGMTNNNLRAVYAYRFHGPLSDLRVEQGKALGFEQLPIEAVLRLEGAERDRFIPSVFSEQTQQIFRKIQQLL